VQLVGSAEVRADAAHLRRWLRQVASVPAPAGLGLLSRYWSGAQRTVSGRYLFRTGEAAAAFLDRPGSDPAVGSLGPLAGAVRWTEPAPLAGPAPLTRPVFLLSAPRAGSTLLFDLLAEATEVWTVGGESHGLIEGIPSLHPGSRNFVSHRLTAAQANAEVVHTLRLAVTAELRDRSGWRWTELAADQRPAEPRWLEKTPENTLRIPFLRAAFPDAQFLVLTRSAADTVASIAEAWQNDGFVNLVDVPGIPIRGWSFLLPDGWRELHGAPLQQVACAQYRAAYEAILAGVAGLPRERWTVVSYEDLVRRPEATVRSLATALGLPRDPDQLAAAVQRTGASATTLTGPGRGKARWAPALPESEAAMLAGIEQRLAGLTEGGGAAPMPATPGTRPFMATPPPPGRNTFRCPLPESGSVSELSAPILHPDVLVQIGAVPTALRRRARFRERIDDRGALLWYDDRELGSLTPWWLPPVWAGDVMGLRPGQRLPFPVSHPLHAPLVRAGLVVDRTALGRSGQWSARLAAPRADFAARGAASLPPLLPDAMRSALAAYYADLIEAGGWSLGDEQVSRRHGWHDETMARFVHHQLIGVIGDVTGMALLPSYCYVSAYRAQAQLAPHVDREQCEVTVSMLLRRSGDSTGRWPLVVETPDGPAEFETQPGHGVVFLGCQFPHYRQGSAAEREETVLLLHYVSTGFSRTLH
jgi:LPS sulfotransferase NodH